MTGERASTLTIVGILCGVIALGWSAVQRTQDTTLSRVLLAEQAVAEMPKLRAEMAVLQEQVSTMAKAIETIKPKPRPFREEGTQP